MRYTGRIWVPEAPMLSLDRGPCPRKTLEMIVDQVAVPRLMGIFSWQLIHARTGHVRMSGSTRNIITDAAMNAIGAGTQTNTMISQCAVGTGASAPAVGQNGLDAELARTTVTSTGDATLGNGAGFLYFWRQRVWLFTEAFANGNLTEMGVFQGAAGSLMWSRQLFKDGLGNPTVIPKTNTDQLKITYEYRIYPPQNDVVGNVLISGTNYAYTVRSENTNNDIIWGGSSGALGKLGDWAGGNPLAGDVQTLGTTQTSPPYTQSANSNTSVPVAYTTGTFYRDITHKWEPATGNFTGGGIGGFRISPSIAGVGLFQMSVNPKIPKINTQRLTLVTRSAWGRYP
jgi:hypothetical protein